MLSCDEDVAAYCAYCEVSLVTENILLESESLLKREFLTY
jgi:hypothetical protein